MKPKTLMTYARAVFQNKRTFKTWIRCCATLAVSLIFLVETDLSDLQGQGAFFTAILAVVLTPAMAGTTFILASLTLIVGMCLGWAWGVAATAAAHAVRDPVRLQQQMQAFNDSIVEDVSVNFQFQSAVFHGNFLDPRASAVFGAFLFIGTFIFATILAYRPRLILLSMFGTIILDVQCSYASNFPNPTFTITKLLLIPTGFYLAIALVALALFFPESLNHLFLTIFRDVYVQAIRSVLNVQLDALTVDIDDKSALDDLVKRGDASRSLMIGGLQNLAGQIALVDLELSVGRLSSADLKDVNKQLKVLTTRTSGLLAFQIAVNNIISPRTMDESASTNQNRTNQLRNALNEKENKHGHALHDLLPILAQSSKPLLDTCTSGLDCVDTWAMDCNSGRWTWFFSTPKLDKIEQRHAAIVTEVDKLKSALAHFRDVERVKLIKPFEKCFDPITGRPLASVISEKGAFGHPEFSARSLFVCFLFCDALAAFGDALLKLMILMEKLDRQRPKPRVWMPIGIGSISGKVKGGVEANTAVAPLAMGTATDPYKFEDTAEALTSVDLEEGMKRNVRDPDALPPRTTLGRFSLKVASVVRFFGDPQAVFALRYAIVSVALWVPSVCQSSAWFAYSQRALWAMIMAQTGLSVFAGDQIYGFFVRLTGTLVGLLLGMACWYIGAGSGNGNAYGIVIITTAMIAPVLLIGIIRPTSALRPFWAMLSITTVFVVGYSWIDSHVQTLVNLGIGVTIAWKRALLIVIGFTASFIMMIVPRVTSSRVFVRKTLAAVLAELSHVFAAEVEAFLAEERRARDGHFEKVEMKAEGDDQDVSAKQQRVRKFTPKMLAVAVRLQEIRPSLQTARLEPQVKGLWPAAKYATLHDKESRILHSTVLLVCALSRLDTKWCSILVHHTPFFNPNFLTDVFMQISILSGALSSGMPLPPIIGLRERLLYHDNALKRRQVEGDLISVQPTRRAMQGMDTDMSGNTDGSDASPDEVDGSAIGFKKLSLNILMDPELPAHSTALIALSNIVSLLDEVSILVKELCGDTTFPSLDLLHRHWITLEEEASRTDVRKST